MSALDKIAELHQPMTDKIDDKWCAACDYSWPCPTRRLCDEADETTLTEAEAERMWQEGEPADISVDPNLRMTIVAGPELQSAMASVDPRSIVAERDAARADAERLAAALRGLARILNELAPILSGRGVPKPDEWTEIWEGHYAALAAHDAFTGDKK